MGADEKHAATYHGGEYTPSTDVVLAAYMECEKRHVRTPDEKAISAFDRWLETVRAEAKAGALEQYHADVLYIDRVIECKAEPDDRWYDFVESENEWRTEEKQGGRRMFNENAATYYAKYRANQYKEGADNGR